jgi:hypothetical protein
MGGSSHLTTPAASQIISDRQCSDAYRAVKIGGGVGSSEGYESSKVRNDILF